MGQSALVITLATAMPVMAGNASQGARPWRVVILDSSEPSEPVAQAFGRAVRQALTRQASRPVEFYTEFLDGLRFGAYEAEWAALLKRKYQEPRPDLVVTIYPEALQFLERHRTGLWPDAPTVFVGVPDDPPAAKARANGIAGVLTHVDIAGTLDLALRLQPETRRVVVVNGASSFDRLWKVRAERALRVHAGRLEASYLDGLAIPELLRRVTDLPPHTIILFTTVFRDPTGPMQPNDVVGQIARVSNVPIYAPFEPSLGSGIVGGSMVQLGHEAERAGRLAVSIFTGVRPESIPVEEPTPPVTTVDWRQMQRFGLSENRLPPGTQVLFRPSSMWSDHRGTIITTLVVVALQSALIAALLVERRQRRRAELHARQRSIELAHASRLAAVGEITASIAHQIDQPLGAILSNADAAEMLLDASPPPLDEVRQILADIRGDDERAHAVVQGMRALLQRREFQVQPVDLNRAIAQVLQVLEGEARRQGVTLRADLADGLPSIEGDRVHLQQVILNLVINGIEAAGGRSGDARVTVRTARNEAGHVEVTVADTGPGIADAQLPDIFESFFTTKADGMGLGLSIARSLVELHGGTIGVENGPNGGATFRFVLSRLQTA